MYFNTHDLINISNKHEAYTYVSHKQIQFIYKKIQSKYLKALTEVYTVYTYIFSLVSLNLVNLI